MVVHNLISVAPVPKSSQSDLVSIMHIKGACLHLPLVFSPQLKCLLCHYQNIFCGALSAIILKEMAAAFDNLWTAVVVVRPPWTLTEAVGIIDK